MTKFLGGGGSQPSLSMAEAEEQNMAAGGVMPSNMSLEPDVDIPDIDPDLFLRSFGISDDYYCGGGGGAAGEELREIRDSLDSLGQLSTEQLQQLGPGSSSSSHTPGVIMRHVGHHQQQLGHTLHLAPEAGQVPAQPGAGAGGQVTLQPRPPAAPALELASVAALQSILAQSSHHPATQQQQQRKRRQDQMRPALEPGLRMPVFTVPSPVAATPVFVDQRPGPMVTGEADSLVTSPGQASRPSPQSTPPPPPEEARGWPRYKSGRVTPTGKRSRPHTPTSDSESDGGWREREPLSWPSTPGETKPSVSRLEELVDEDKYNKRKRSTSDGEAGAGAGRRRDPMKAMLEQLQQNIPHIGNPDEEKVSHAGLLLEGSDYIRSLKRENSTTGASVEHLKLKIAQLHAEIEAFQEQLPEHGSSSIHRIVSARGKSIPDMFADHVRQRTQSDWKYWVYTSIMGHFVHSFAQEVSNISPQEMERTSTEWVQEKMSMTQLRKDAFRKLAKLCSKTSIMEDPSKLPEEARGFVALSEADKPDSKAEFEPL